MNMIKGYRATIFNRVIQCGSQLICCLLRGPWWDFRDISKQQRAQAANVSCAEINKSIALIQCRQGITQGTSMHTLYMQFEDCLDLGIHLCKIYEVCFNDCLSDRKSLEHWSELLTFLFCFRGGTEAEYGGVIVTLARNGSSQVWETIYLNETPRDPI